MGGIEWILAGSGLLNLVAVGKLVLQARKDNSDGHWRLHERGWLRTSELEEEVRRLRIALHKASARSSVRLTISEILVLAMPLPLEARIEAVRQAREIAERSLERGA